MAKPGVDPRPDLREDSFFWRQALRLAYPAADFFGLLHGLRCGGARLTITEKGSFRLDFKQVVDDWPGETMDSFRARWLEPHRELFVGLFRDLAKVA